MPTELNLSKNDFCITVSLTGYRIYYRGTEIDGTGRMGWESSLRGVAATMRRFAYARQADRIVGWLLNGKGTYIQKVKLEMIQRGETTKYLTKPEIEQQWQQQKM